METSKLKKFAQFARRSLLEQVAAKLKLVLADESPARRESPQAIKKLEKAIGEQSKEQVIERVAYIWFNRFCALRFMDVNRYNRIGIVSPAEGQFQPEILADAKMGHIDEEMVLESTRQNIFALLDGKTPSQDPQGEAYRLLVVATCNYWYGAMPFLFERIEDYTELLMPDDLLSGSSILAYTREAMTPDACQDVEVIGWIYQFYISEKKDLVFEGLKTNQKVTPDNIPAATQLFTPHWIVRYLVENSLGRLWMLNRPSSGLTEQMDYYITPEMPETDFLRISTPEEIKICDPACGSGHMLTYAFDLLYAIYEEEGYEPADIPPRILTHNLYGIEIDERAGELAAFALTMKARAKQRRFFRNPVQPNVVVLENVTFTESEMQDVVALVGKDLFTDELRETLYQFDQAKNFGSLIVPNLRDPAETLREVEARECSSDMLLKEVQSRVVVVLRMAEALSPKYPVVVANPPYMGVSNANAPLSDWAKAKFPASKADLYSMFMERNLALACRQGLVAMVNMQSWMFLSSFEKLRAKLLTKSTILTMAHLGERGFDTIGGAVVSTTAFVLWKKRTTEGLGDFLRLVEGGSEGEKAKQAISGIADRRPPYYFQAGTDTFESIPGNIIAYWLSDSAVSAFLGPPFSSKSTVCIGMQSGDNDKHFRYWHEVASPSINGSLASVSDAKGRVWSPLQRGGSARKWFGSELYVANMSNEGREILRTKNAALRNVEKYFQESVCWNRLSQGNFQARYVAAGHAFDDLSPFSVSGPETSTMRNLALMNSKAFAYLLSFISSGFKTEVGHVSKVPLPTGSTATTKDRATALLSISRVDWDAYETSWGFTTLSLLQPDYRAETLEASYSTLRDHWQSMTDEMQRLEEENNRIFIDAYCLQDELTPDVTLEEITLTCNPHYRYGNNKSEEALEALLLADTVRELISYAVGCMFGRFALEQPGLILASQGETIEDYLKKIPEPSVPADDDNVIPVLDGDWFTDDITERFREFLRIVFGEEHYEENLRFVEQALGKDIRKYFLKDFYNDHVRRYKKRPIYWLFSSPKGSFNALIYMHRYQSHTVGTVLEYLRDFKDEKLKSRKYHLEAVSVSGGASPGDKTKALKEIEKINKILSELDDYERDVLYPLATEQVEIDLDEGVKANYPRFGEALKKITGLSQ